MICLSFLDSRPTRLARGRRGRNGRILRDASRAVRRVAYRPNNIFGLCASGLGTMGFPFSSARIKATAVVPHRLRFEAEDSSFSVNKATRLSRATLGYIFFAFETLIIRSMWVALKRAVCCGRSCLSSFASDTTRQLNVFRHDGDTFGVDRTKVGVFEEANQVSFACLLQRHHGAALKTQVGLEVLGDFTNQSLERKFADEQFGRLLVTTDFSQGDGARPVTVRFLHSAGGGRALSRCLGSKLLSWGFATGALSRRLLCACHYRLRCGISYPDE